MLGSEIKINNESGVGLELAEVKSLIKQSDFLNQQILVANFAIEKSVMQKLAGVE